MQCAGEPGTACVWGPASGRTKFGILGTARGEVEAGVAGVSVSTTQPIAVSNPQPGELTPSGGLVGVLGMSGTGPGVKGHSEWGDGPHPLAGFQLSNVIAKMIV
jgi:hypothetical protein